MDSKKFKNKLNKIATIFDSMQADHSISSLEKELLKKYVVQLYETLLEETKGTSKSVDSVNTKVIDEAPKKEPVKEASELSQTSAPAAPQAVSSPIPETPAPSVNKTVIAEPVKEKVAVSETIKQAVPVAVATATASTVVANTLEMSAELQPIFERIEATELSDRLSISKVKDIGKSMGINEKIFTIKELFAGDQSLFNSVISKLDACESYDEAAQYLSSTVARDQKWGDASKVKKAKTFVKLVQRKFV